MGHQQLGVVDGVEEDLLGVLEWVEECHLEVLKPQHQETQSLKHPPRQVSKYPCLRHSLRVILHNINHSKLEFRLPSKTLSHRQVSRYLKVKMVHLNQLLLLASLNNLHNNNQHNLSNPVSLNSSQVVNLDLQALRVHNRQVNPDQLDLSRLEHLDLELLNKQDNNNNNHDSLVHNRPVLNQDQEVLNNPGRLNSLELHNKPDSQDQLALNSQVLLSK